MPHKNVINHVKKSGQNIEFYVLVFENFVTISHVHNLIDTY